MDWAFLIVLIISLGFLVIMLIRSPEAPPLINTFCAIDELETWANRRIQEYFERQVAEPK
jgi:hypothetical protein